MVGPGQGEPPPQEELAMIFPRTTFEVHSPLLNPQLETTINQVFPSLILTYLRERAFSLFPEKKSKIEQIPSMIQVLEKDQFVKANVDSYLKPQEPKSNTEAEENTSPISPEWRQFLDQFIRAVVKPENDLGFCRYDEDGNLTGIFLLAPNLDNPNDVSRFIRTFVHEITHAVSVHIAMRPIIQKRFFPGQSFVDPKQLKQYEELFTFYFETQFLSEHFPQFTGTTETALFKDYNQLFKPLDRYLGNMYFYGRDTFIS